MGNKPSLTLYDGVGEHNKDVDKTNAKLIKGGSWKKQRVIVIIPAADLMPSKVSLSHWNLAFPPNNGVVRILAQGYEVGDAYSSAIEQILANPDLSQWEYILTIEHDNCPPSDGVIQLIEDLENHPEFAAISGLYHCKGWGGCPHVWGDIHDIPNYRPQTAPVQGEIKECWGLSMGFCLYRLSMFKDPKLRRPWFKTVNGKGGEGIGTQDLYAWGDFHKHGYRCAVSGNVRVGHYDYKGDFGIPDFMW